MQIGNALDVSCTNDQLLTGPNLFFFTSLITVETGKWRLYGVPTDIVRPSYGHSSAYDPGRQLIYVHGGFVEGEKENKLSKSLTSYDPIARTW